MNAARKNKAKRKRKKANATLKCTRRPRHKYKRAE
jgi:hypothetical protein